MEGAPDVAVEIVSADSQTRAVPPPPVALTEVILGQQPVDPAKAATAPYHDRFLLVRFAALSFLNEHSIVFRYRLVGQESEWTENAWKESNSVPTGRAESGNKLSDKKSWGYGAGISTNGEGGGLTFSDMSESPRNAGGPAGTLESGRALSSV